MQSARFAAQDALNIATFASKTAKYLTNRLNNKSNSTTRCSTCNNLQPDGQGTIQNLLSTLTSNPAKQAPKEELLAVPYLTITESKTKDVLATREIDPETKRPKRDCRFCCLLGEVFDAFFVDEWMSWITETQNGMHIRFGLMIKQGAPLVVECRNFTYDPGVTQAREDVELFTDDEGVLGMAGVPTLGLAGVRAGDSSDERCLKFLKECVEECCAGHGRCKEGVEGFQPTRLVLLGRDNGDMKLVESTENGSPVKWVAFSHCWGGFDPLKLAKGNHEDLKQRIWHDDLPPTFKDAITISRLLGVQYLWIDSLCIVQDDTKDWEIESACMGKVYSGAHVVLVGSSSKTPEENFLGPRDEEWSTKRFNFETEHGEIVPIFARKRHMLAAPLEQGQYEPPFTASWSNKRFGPLYTRGWCFQEAHLARRAIHMTPGAIIFECKTHRRSEDQLPPYPLTYPGTLGEISEADQWHAMIKAYTSRQVTFPKDRLPATSGLAASMAQAKRGKCLAGLWRETLLTDILWQVMPGSRALHYPLTYDLAEQAAPTWSWASMTRAITFNPLKTPEPLAEVIAAECAIEGENPFGAVSAGIIKLKGHLRHCRISYHTNEAHANVYLVDKNGKRGSDCHFIPDGLLVADRVASTGAVYARRARQGESKADMDAPAFFFCIARTPYLNYNYVGLILGPSFRIPGAFERIGNVTNLGREWYTSGEEATVTII